MNHHHPRGQRLAGILSGAFLMLATPMAFAVDDITAPNGGAVAVIAAQPSANAAYGFDNNTSTQWSPLPGELPIWIQYQFTNGQKFAVFSYNLRGDNTYGTRSPKDFYFSGSTNGTDWTTLDSQANITGWTAGQWRQFTFANSVPYSHFRLTITANGGAAGGVTVAELELYAIGELAPASNPAPAHLAAQVKQVPTLAWDSSGLSNRVYFSTESELTQDHIRTNTLAHDYRSDILDYETVYYWRIDTMTDGNIKTGSVWSFTTTSRPPAQVTYDGFETYAIGNLNGQGTAGDGWLNAWTAVAQAQVVETSLVYQAGSLTVNGGIRAVRIGNIENYSTMGRRFAAQETTPVYFSLLILGSTPVGDLLSVGLKDDTASVGHSAGFQFAYHNNAINAELYAADDSPFRASTGIAPNNNQAYFIVARLERIGANLDYERVKVLVNPSGWTEPESGWTTATFTPVTSTRLTRLNVRTYGMEINDYYVFDELRIGTTYESVLPPIVNQGMLIMLQ